MKRAVFLYSIIFICMAAAPVALGQSDAGPIAKPGAKAGARKACPFSIVGLWKSDATTESTPTFYNFASDGWVTLLGHTAETLPQDFEMITAVNYRLDKPDAPKAIEFTASRGNDTFRRGTTSMEITEYSDDSFVTLDPASGQQTRWNRVQTHLYFLTLAARGGSLPQGGYAFAMWTVLDGRKTETGALGVKLISDESGKTLPDFGPIPAEIYSRLTDESDKEKHSNKDGNVYVRIELTEAEFETARGVFQAWDKYVKAGKLPYGDPYLNAMELIKKSAESLNRCGEKVKLPGLSQRERDESASKNNLPQALLAYVKAMREKNDRLHVNNKTFPSQWSPMVQAPGQ